MLALTVGLALSGCTGQDAPDPLAASPEANASARGGAAAPGLGASGQGLVPLQVGNQWDYHGSLAVRITPYGSDTESQYILRDEVRTVVGSETYDGRNYTVIEVAIDEHEYGQTMQSLLFRQTHTGLFQYNGEVAPPIDAPVAGSRDIDPAWVGVAASVPPAQRGAYRVAWDELVARRETLRRAMTGGVAAVPGNSGADENETTQLVYPLHPGQEWNVLDEPLFTARVERRVRLYVSFGLVSAWQIQLRNEFMGPRDRAIEWYGELGFIGYILHIETVATDESGQPIGTLVGDERLVMTDTNLLGPKGIQ
ncbi:MAG TPA: hypothetical protein VFX92_04925 [Candidatus Krumholzibacteria bacterium]|nr:hypothetical protein [Candidatus Krumholzibacteria bacterium]